PACGLGIPPDHLAKVGEDPCEPFETGLEIAVLDAAVDLRQFVRTHRGIAHENDAPIRAVGADQFERAEALVLAPKVVAPDVVVDAIVDIEILDMAKFGPRGREQFLAELDVRIHRAADVEEQQHFDAIAPFGLQLQVEPAGIFRGAFDRAVEIELLRHAFAREAAQPSKRDLDVARVEVDIAVEIAEAALVPDLDGAARAAGVLSDSN